MRRPPWTRCRLRESVWAVMLALAPATALGTEDPPDPRAAARPSAQAVDYNAASPDPTLGQHLHAIANLGVQSWVLWQASWLRGEEWPFVTRDSLAHNLHHGFVFDQDEMQTNFLGHPYHGGLMFSSARSAGLGFWTSVAYTGAGSLAWEYFAEKEAPSANDLIMTTLPGLMLGEITYRLASELLDDSSYGSARVWRELGGAAVSPVRGFHRLNTGQAWSEGPPAIRHPVRAALHLGAEVVRVKNGRSTDRNGPSLLVATDIRYGSLLAQESAMLEPFTFFELYASLSLFDSELAGARVDTTGLLVGWRHALSRRPRDAAIFGVSMNYEFQGSNVTTYGGVGVGPSSYLSVGLGGSRQLRLGIGVDLVPMLSIAKGERGPDERGYAFTSGGASWSSLWLDLDGAGSLSVRARQYATAILDGGSGVNYVAAVRGAYHVSALEHLGFGAAPMLTYHRPSRGEPDTLELSGQLFLRLHD